MEERVTGVRPPRRRGGGEGEEVVLVGSHQLRVGEVEFGPANRRPDERMGRGVSGLRRLPEGEPQDHRAVVGDGAEEGARVDPRLSDRPAAGLREEEVVDETLRCAPKIEGAERVRGVHRRHRAEEGALRCPSPEAPEGAVVPFPATVEVPTNNGDIALGDSCEACAPEVAEDASLYGVL